MDRETADRLKAAEAAVGELSKEFVEFAQEDLDLAQKSLNSAKETPNNRAEIMATYYTAIHNIKGLGGSFGYSLVTSVANSNCRLLTYLNAEDEQVLRLCEAHIVTLDMILSKNIKGDGGDAGDQIVAKLSGNVDKLFAERSVEE